MRNLHSYSVDILYENRLKQLNMNKKQLLILGTIARSGTHYSKFLIGNYLKLAAGNSDGSLTGEEMYSMLPNRWYKSYLNVRNMPFGSIWPDEYKKPTPHLELLGLQDIARSHEIYQTRFWDDSPVLHLYRNPLDYAVSIYYYMYKNRQGAIKVKSPVEVLDLRFNSYVRMYMSYRMAARAGNAKLLRISYEDLKRYPETCLRIILRWLGVEPRDSLVNLAVQYSAIKNVKKLEEAGGVVNPTATSLKGKFARDGSIGQWKKYFNNTDINRFRQKFKDVGISLDEFTLEP
ncbi:MAG: sulfotransferase domain-containing protein [Candidatus Aureabacteria bacterium]|nr:sulfotransferase domain-containing protein [Candidatus Auribacterota bacterium]